MAHLYGISALQMSLPMNCVTSSYPNDRNFPCEPLLGGLPGEAKHEKYMQMRNVDYRVSFLA